MSGRNGFLLGNTKIVHAGETLKLNSRKALALLGYLAQQGRPIERDVLIELLWSEDDAPGAKGSMRTLLKNLRKQLGKAFYADRQVVALEENTIIWDIDRFSALAAQDDIAAWVQASTLYQGEFMRGFQLDASVEFEDWLETTRNFWFDAVNRVLRNISDYYLHHGQAEKALAYTRRWLELEPWQEKAHRQQMWLHWQLGNFDDALAQYERCSTRLERDLDIEPSPQTFELYELILKDQSDHQWQNVREHTHPQQPIQQSLQQSLQQSAPEPAQLASPSSEKPEPPPHAADAATSETQTLVADPAASASVTTHVERAFRQRYALSSFVGRKRELGALLEALQQHRLVSVLGLAGVGKSRLAYELIYGVCSRQPSTQRHRQRARHDMANDITDTNTVADNNTDTYTVTDTNTNMFADVRVIDGTSLTAAELKRYFAAETTSGATSATNKANTDEVNANKVNANKVNANKVNANEVNANEIDKAYLLLIDGLTEPFAEVRDVLSGQLATEPHLRVLITARYPLEISGEKRVHLTGLSAAPKNTSLKEIPENTSPQHTSWQNAQKSDAVQLFYERARLYMTGFTLDANNTPMIAALCRLVSGLPRALEQLAAWLEVMPVRLLHKSLLEPTDPNTAMTMPPDWLTELLEISWQPLDEVQRLCYAACAVFADGFDAKAAHAVTDMTMPQLHMLVSRSLLEAQQGRYILPRVFRPLLLRYLSGSPAHNLANRSTSHQTSHINQLAARHGTFYVTCLAVPGALTAADSSNVQRAWHYLCHQHLCHHHLCHQRLTHQQTQLDTYLPEHHASEQTAMSPRRSLLSDGDLEHPNLAHYLPLLVTYYQHYGSLHTLLSVLENTWQAVSALPATALQLHTLAYLSRVTLQCGNHQQAHDHLEQAHARSSLSSLPIPSCDAYDPTSSQPSTVSALLTSTNPIQAAPASSDATNIDTLTPKISTDDASNHAPKNAPKQTMVEAMNAVLLASGVYALLTGDNDTADAHFRGLLEQANYQQTICYYLACLALQQGDVSTARQWQRALEARATTRNPAQPHAEPHQNPYEHTPEFPHGDGRDEEDTLTAKRWLLAMRLELASGHISNAQRHFVRLRTLAERTMWRDVAFQVAFYGATLHDNPLHALEQAFDIAHARADQLGALAAANAWLWCAYDTGAAMPRRCEVQNYVVNVLGHPDTLPTTSLLTALLALAALNLNSNDEMAYILATHVAQHPATPFTVRQQALRYLEADVPDAPERDVLALLPAALDNLTPCM